MGKQKTLIILMFLTICSASAQDLIEKSQESFIPNTDEIPVFLYVNCLDNGYYHLYFWIHPTLLRDGNFSEYKVYVNGGYEGIVSTDKEGWQSASLERNRKVYLNKGINTIAVSCLSPEVPCVEAVNASTESTVSGFSPEAYTSYINNLRQNPFLSPQNIADNPQEIFSFTDTTYISVPLKYSFRLLREYNQNDIINFTTTSSTPHKLDVFFYGERTVFNPIYLGEGDTTDGIRIDPIVIRRKNVIAYEPATNSQAQGLNWLGVSESDNGGNHTIYKTITIPRTGLYMIKLRGSGNGVQGLADLCINQTEYHNDCPFFYYGNEVEFPADHRRHSAMAYSSWPGHSDPMIFIEGNVSERVVAFNDDHSDINSFSYGLDEWDPFVEMVFSVKTSAIHLSNYGSLNPDTTCILRFIANAGNGVNAYSPQQFGENLFIIDSKGLS